MINPDKDHRNPLSKIGGKLFIASLDITKPNPSKQGTMSANSVSLEDKLIIKEKVNHTELQFSFLDQ